MNIQQKFEKFNREHPTVYKELVRLAQIAKIQGVSRYSAKAMFEIVRWNLMRRRLGRSFRINNNFTSRYARLINKNEPELRNFFTVRKLKA
jgi:hypothetical protein